GSGTAPAGPDARWSLHTALSRLWLDHVTWTRGYVVVATGKRSVAEFLTLPAAAVVRLVAVPLGAVISLLGFADAAAVRLMRNQHDIGQSVVPFYGSSAGSKLRRLMKKHITLAVKMISAARHGHVDRFGRLEAKWDENADQIADLLASANPNWQRADLVDLLRQHLSLTKRAVAARLEQRWEDDVDAVDQIYTEILTVAGALADGIIAQFPEKFPQDGLSEQARSLKQAMRRLWSDHAIWTRQYIVAAIDGKPEADAAAKRLLRNQTDIGQAVAGFYGEEAGAALTNLLTQHVTIAVDIVDAATKKDAARFDTANKAWDRNADEIASLLSSANPNWPKRDVLDLLMQHLNLTRDEVTAHLKRRRPADVKAFDLIQTEILTLADVLSDGIIKQFPARV
ncbi:MAG: hypothetical protein L0H84_22445, partial [Pseudonocardia sp.]|nr:hypothetical protein [Pseudonocardia sp.]